MYTGGKFGGNFFTYLFRVPDEIGIVELSEIFKALLSNFI
jgi:hypothetical protein